MQNIYTVAILWLLCKYVSWAVLQKLLGATGY